MVDRRRAARFVFRAPSPADVRIVQDAVLEAHAGDRACVLTTEPAAPGDAYVLEFRGHDGALTTLRARVMSSTPVVRDLVVNYRLELAITTAACSPDAAPETSPLPWSSH